MSNLINVKVGNFETIEDFVNIDSTGCVLPIKVTGVVHSFKGETKMESVKTQRMADGFQQRKFLKIREQERVLFSTGLRLIVPEGIKGHINTAPQVMMLKGLEVKGPDLIISDEGELQVLVHNNSLHLTRVELNEVLAVVTFSPIMNLDYKLEI